MKLSFTQIARIARGETLTLEYQGSVFTINSTPKGYLITKNGRGLKLVKNLSDLALISIY
jgi:hypothetical protein